MKFERKGSTSTLIYLEQIRETFDGQCRNMYAFKHRIFQNMYHNKLRDIYYFLEEKKFEKSGSLNRVVFVLKNKNKKSQKKVAFENT